LLFLFLQEYLYFFGLAILLINTALIIYKRIWGLRIFPKKQGWQK